MEDKKEDLKTFLFTEKQRFNQWLLWMLLLAINGFFLYRIYKQNLVDDSQSNAGSWLGLGIIILVMILIYSIQLETKIDKNGVHVRLLPFHLTFRNYPWSNLTKVFVRQYEPISEFGGWGIRFGDNGSALNVSGNMGLQLEFPDSKKLLIGIRPTKCILIR